MRVRERTASGRMSGTRPTCPQPSQAAVCGVDVHNWPSLRGSAVRTPCHDAAVNELEFRLSRKQPMTFLISGGVLLVVGVFSATVTGRWTSSPSTIVGVLFILESFLFATFRVTINEDGIDIRVLRTRHIPWQRIQSVERCTLLGTTGVRLRLIDGRPVRLRVPVTGFGQRDPEFDAKAATIHQWWQHYTGQLTTPP
jgi:hypothetical protein